MSPPSTTPQKPYEKMLVPQLRKECELNNLDSKGVKASLIQRLKDNDMNGKKEEEEEEGGNSVNGEGGGGSNDYGGDMDVDLPAPTKESTKVIKESVNNSIKKSGNNNKRKASDDVSLVVSEDKKVMTAGIEKVVSIEKEVKLAIVSNTASTSSSSSSSSSSTSATTEKPPTKPPTPKLPPAAPISCPYLDQINPKSLTFTLKKLCVQTLSPSSVYACLICGKYFHGRGKTTPAYIHSLSEEGGISHNVFVNLTKADGSDSDDVRFYCLPENYEILNEVALLPIQNAIKPTFSKMDISYIDRNVDLKRDVFGAKYLPGYGGMNSSSFVRGLGHNTTGFINCVVIREIT